MTRPYDGADEVAVIGMAGRFPGASDLLQFWDNLAAGRMSIDTLTDAELDAAGVPAEIYRAPGYVRASSRLADVECFDAELFGYSPREAAMLDPQARLSLQLAWHALEDAGQGPLGIEMSVGVFATASLNTYLLQQLAGRIDRRDFILGLANIPIVLANAPDFIATRLSYKLNLRGPSVAVQTACSSSLTAIHLARQSILNGECDMALAGGVSIYLPQDVGYQYQDGLMLSRDGRCRAFDADADGVLFGRGGGFVLLKSMAQALADGDRIRAIVRGSAVNNDGAEKVGFTAPSIGGQARVIAEALADAGVSADSISYVEAHGTGTRLGDPIEVAALSEAFRAQTTRQGFCALGTVKTNIGHLDVASGVTGFIKTVLMLEHAQIVPSLNFSRSNPAIDLELSPFRISTRLQLWEPSGGVRRAGVSSFGMGGTNAHVVLEQAPGVPAAADTSAPPMQVLRLAAQSGESLSTLAGSYAALLRNLPPADLAHLCFAANCGRAHLPQRLVARASTATELASALETALAGHPEPKVVRGAVAPGEGGIAFLFPGMGSQFAGMGRQLFESQPVFRDLLQRCDELLRDELATPLLDVLYPPAGAGARIDDTSYTQPALFAFEVALARLWESWGIRAAAVIGHSLGEYAAACIAGLLPLEEGLRVVAARGRLMASVAPGGAMCAVHDSEQTVAAALAAAGEGAVTIASINGPRHTVISGATSAVERVAQHLTDLGVQVQPLNVRQAFHSHLLDPMLDAFEQEMSRVHFGHASIPLISNLTGRSMGAEGREPHYWRQHARQPVRFADGIRSLYERGVRTFLEIGPHTVASGMAAGCLSDGDNLCLPSLRRGRSDSDQMLEALSILYVRGARPDWSRIQAPAARRHISLPLYPFARQRHWLEPAAAITATAPNAPASASPSGSPLVAGATRSPLHEALSLQLRPDPASHAFLMDHCIGDTPVFPATGYLEAAFEAVASAGDQTCVVLESLQIFEPLPVEASHEAQLILRPEERGWHFELHQWSADQGWRQHARGRLLRGSPCAVVTASPAELRARCSQRLAGDAYYSQLALAGYCYGPAFRGIDHLWLGQNECVAEVVCPESLLRHLAQYRCHPALFDACLQAVLALLPAAHSFLPVSFDKVELLAPLTARMLAHARLHPPGATGARIADVEIFDANGAPLVRVTGIVLRQRRVAKPQATAWRDWLYEMGWRASPVAAELSPLPSPLELQRDMYDELVRLRNELQIQDYEAIQEPLDSACAAYAALALQTMGWQPQIGDSFSTETLSQALGVLPKHHPMLHRLLEMLAEDGLLERPTRRAWRVLSVASVPSTSWPELATLRAHYPQFQKMFEMVERCGRALASGLRGSLPVLDLLFPKGSLADMELLYHSSPFARVYNRLSASAVDALVSAQGSAPLRVLEVGAGTGGTSAAVLARLPAQRTRYIYTDVSPLFLARAEERFAQYPFIEYRLFDVERDPVAQGLEPAGFDLIIASNVLHTAAELQPAIERMRSLLAPGGHLLLIEGIARQRWVDLLFGLTDGWWHFTDYALRQDYPLLSQSSWMSLLAAAGFEHTIAVPGVERPAELFHQALMLARRPGAGGAQPYSQGAAGRRGLLVAQRADAFTQLAQAQLAAYGGALEFLAADAALAGQIGTQHFDDVLFLAPVAAEDHATGVPRPEAARALLALVQSLAMQSATTPTRLWIVTCGARSVLPQDRVTGMATATLWGLADVVALEHPQLRCTCIDVEHSDAAAAAELLQQVAHGGNETRLAFRGGVRYVARLGRIRIDPEQSELEPTEQRVISGAPGLLDALRFADSARRAPAAGQVEIHVQAAGLNFKDVLTALGRFEPAAHGFGFECAGEVVAVGSDVHEFAVGDAVMAFTPGSLADYVLADACFVAHKPAAISFEQAAAFPGAFLTAHHSLFELARLRGGERLLIHAASGGVGLAALQLAQCVGAEVYATAGSDAKRSYLRALGLEHVFDSRSTAFAEAIRTNTAGDGVDVVLNSQTGDVLEQSRRLLARGGRFVELGRPPLQSADARAGGARPGYFNPDVASDYAAEPARFGSVYRRLVERLALEQLDPLPCRVFERTELAAAFRLMARAGHVGKVVLRLQPKRVANASTPAISPAARYLIVGGLGDLGLLLAEWLVDHGARYLALVSRRSAGEAEQAAVNRLRSRGAEILLIRADVTDHAETAGVIEELRRRPQPLRGVFHAAGVLDDGVLEQQTWQRFERVLAPKVTGAWNLHRLTRDLPLDYFVLFSSVASLLGSAGQANHAAANAYLDALAWHRRAEGLPALSINWGAWSSVGAAARGGVGGRLALRGIGEIAPDVGIAAFEHLLGWPKPQIGVMPVDWNVYVQQFGTGNRPAVLTEVMTDPAPVSSAAAAPPRNDFPSRLAAAAPAQRHALLLELVRTEIIRGLGLDASKQLPVGEPLIALGVDSLLAVELRNSLSSALGLARRLPATLLFDYPSMSALADYLLSHTLDNQDGSTSAPNTNLVPPSEEAAIAALSDEEAEALLMKELG